MFEYTICNEANQDIFKRQCAALVKNIDNLQKGTYIKDVDNSEIQEYILDGKKLTVHNSVYLNSVYIKSEFDLDKIFS